MQLLMLLTLIKPEKSVHKKDDDIQRTRKSIPLYPEKDQRKYPIYQKHAVSTENIICSQLGTRILQRGGNAVDGAISAAICIGITNAFSSGIGGGGFLLGYKKNGPKEDVFSYDFREVAPASIDLQHFREHPEDAKKGGMSVGVPGEIAGFYKAHKRYGKLPWSELFKENIEVAKGFPATKILEIKLERNKESILSDPGLRQVYTNGGRLLKERDIVRRVNYANTLKKLASNPEDFYSGSIAQSLVKKVKENGGVIEESDFKNYKAVARKPISIDFYGFKVYTTPFPTAGALVAQGLKILEKLDISNLRKNVASGELKTLYHTLVETYKFIAASRGELGDPDFQRLQKKVKDVISEKNADKAANKIEDNSVKKDTSQYGIECPFCEDHGTTHINVIDKDSMIVEITSTINLEFGSKLMDPDTGILLNNQMDDFFIPGVTNAYGLSKAGKNILQPRRRPFSSAAPTLIVGSNEIIAIGAAGGTRIPTAILNAVVYMILGLGIDQAIRGVRIHEQLIPSTVYVETFFPEALTRQLKSLGHKVEISTANTTFTSVQGMHIFFAGKRRYIFAIADPRKGGDSNGE